MKKTQNYCLIVTFFMFFNMASNVVAAESRINLAKQQLINQAEQFVISQLVTNDSQSVTVNTMPIDQRINIPVCPDAYTFEVNPQALNQSNITVKAECEGNNWYMFIVVQAHEVQPVVVLASAVSPGTLLTKHNVRIIDMDKKRLRSTTYADIEQVIGARIKRRIPAGRPVEPNNLCFVCKGDSITISAVSAVMHVKTTGIALEDGRMGETITVRNSRSKKRIQAVVADTGRVQINI